MAARHTDITVTPGAAVALTDGAVSYCRVYNPKYSTVYLQATATNVAPTSRAGALPLSAGATLAADLALADLFPGVSASTMYLWAFAETATDLSVSHA